MLGPLGRLTSAEARFAGACQALGFVAAAASARAEGTRLRDFNSATSSVESEPGEFCLRRAWWRAALPSMVDDLKKFSVARGEVDKKKREKKRAAD